MLSSCAQPKSDVRPTQDAAVPNLNWLLHSDENFSDLRHWDAADLLSFLPLQSNTITQKFEPEAKEEIANPK